MSGFVMELNDLLHDRRELEFRYGTQDVPIAYNPGALTLDAAQRDEDEENATERVFGLLLEVLLEWPITQDGKPLAIDEAAMRMLPMPFLVAMQTAILDDATGNAGSGSPARTATRSKRRK